MNTYALLDSGNGEKWEQFGAYSVIRPAAQAVWRPNYPLVEWKGDGHFTRKGAMRWTKSAPKNWKVTIHGITFLLKPTDFGHLGVFPEHQEIWRRAEKWIVRGETSVLNLFAYSGGATLALAKAGAALCHVDASKGMVQWARENAKENGLEGEAIRWIVDDVNKFLDREIKRERTYDGIILDPPSYGRGASGEVFKFEQDIVPLLEKCFSLLSKTPKFIYLSCHTAQITPQILANLLARNRKGTIDMGELSLKGEQGVLPLPSGVFAEWTP